MTPKELVQTWVEAFNRADGEALAALYAEDAVNHQVAEAPVEGRPAIRQMFLDGFAAAAMTCIVDNIFQDGQWGIRLALTSAAELPPVFQLVELKTTPR